DLTAGADGRSRRQEQTAGADGRSRRQEQTAGADGRKTHFPFVISHFSFVICRFSELFFFNFAPPVHGMINLNNHNARS
ncbi:MAG TPA: hypothetical protein VIF64_07705, partial [Pyrinomonadaceae bacterium]